MTTEYTIYFAGELFNHKDLIGNALLATYVGRESDGRYRCVVPQDLEQSSGRAVDIRNQDLKHLMECDLAIFNFDGTELDSGTVVEFMFAKMLDIPSVIMRSDFRSSGDQDKDGDDWNLMASFYPRTRKVQFNSMQWYQEETAGGGSLDDVTGRLYRRIAGAVIEALDAVKSETPLPKGAKGDVEKLYQWALRFPGSGLADAVDDVKEIVDGKVRKGLLEGG